MMRLCAAIIVLGGLLFVLSASGAAPQKLGDTAVMKWKDGKQAVFLLAFDDACPTHRTKVIPELIKRDIPATFYVIAGNKGLFNDQWKPLVANPNIVLGNHTWTHKDFPTIEKFEDEIVKANAAITAMTPQLPADRLISFGKPGGVKYGITDQQIAEVLARHHLVLRPSFFSYPWGIKDTEHMHAYIEKTIASGKMGHFDMHGVAGDWLATPWDFFTDLLDTLEAHRDQLWLTDHISYHKYLTERQTAKATVDTTGADRITLHLTCGADGKWYDQPLTLRTAVPQTWRKCRVKQGDAQTVVPVTDGRVMYDALPSGQAIELIPAD